MSQTNLIKVTVYFNKKSHSLLISPNDLVNHFSTLLCQTFNITLKEYDILCNNQRIPQHSFRKMSEYINEKNANASFVIKKKEKSLSQPSKKKPIAVIMEDYPSLIDLTTQIQLFCNSHFNQVNYDVEYRSNWCQMTFEENSNGVAFIHFLANLKRTNQLYYKMKVRKALTDITEDTTYEAFKIKPAIMSYKSNVSQSKSQLSVVSKHKADHLCRSLREDPIKEKELLKKYYANQLYVRNSSPYISEDEKRGFEEKRSKRYWVGGKRGFIYSVGRLLHHFEIKNYVNATPSEPPLIHKFREVNKTKWLLHKGFI